MVAVGRSTAIAAKCDDADVCESQRIPENQERAAALLQVASHSTKPQPRVALAHAMPAKADNDGIGEIMAEAQANAMAEASKTTIAVVEKKSEPNPRIGQLLSNSSALAVPPNQGPILWNMIRAENWLCDMITFGDHRQKSCGIPIESETLHPQNINCAIQKCSIEHANSFRTMSALGALPCCATAPFCAAPACAQPAAPPRSDLTCTKRTAGQNLAYMKSPEAWPAYYGWGGSFELDTLKFLDLLACRKGAGNCPETPFDLAIDLGANTGYYTEKLSVRNWAKNYVMIEANPDTSAVLERRWGNDTWRQAWFTKQVTLKEGQRVPEIAIINKPLSNHSGGVLDMCETERSMKLNKAGCIVPISSVDDIVAQGLPDKFQQHLKEAQSAFIKVDTEGMDELVLRGMKNLLGETRGTYEDGSTRYLVNFFQFEFAPSLMAKAKEREGFGHYDIKSATEFLESIGFESFLIGPRYLPLSHGSWNDGFKTWPEDVNNIAGKQTNYPSFSGKLCPFCKDRNTTTFCSDIFAMRSSHPRATEIKVALGSCQESTDFNVTDPSYASPTEA